MANRPLPSATSLPGRPDGVQSGRIFRHDGERICDNYVFGGAYTPRFSLYRHGRRRRHRRRRRAWPLIAQMNPDASTIAAGAPIEVDLAPIAEGQVIKVFWRGKPIFINHRTKKEIEEAQHVNVASLPDPQPDQQRVKEGHDQWQVLIGICTHLGCIPIAHQGDYDGYFCPCHGSVYDTSGRIRTRPGAGQPAAASLRIRLRHQDPDRLTADDFLKVRP